MNQCLIWRANHGVSSLVLLFSTATHRYLPDSTVFVLAERTEHLPKAHEASPSQDRVIDASAFFADPDVARACREKALIETPDYKLRDDSSQMGKTRGGALRSEVSFRPRLHPVASLYE